MVENTTKQPDRWAEVERVFHACLDVSTDQRVAVLAQTEKDDPSLAKEVARLLLLHDPTDTFLEPPKTRGGLACDEPCDQAHRAGEQVGSFRLVRPIASGGMGSVWLGERVGGGFEQRVAIKLMNIGILTSERRRRFESERQTLARLEHPYITRLIDGGAAADGTPYLAMEYVDGKRLDTFCDDSRMSIRDRLRLFQQFCEAVHFAHTNLIVHRDLKPGNMMVTSQGQPKLLDFGISKLVDETSETARDDITVTLIRALTPRYASPEQIRGRSVTTASDVYSLGVVLYELLTGHRPYEIDIRSPIQQERAICEQEPTLPSVVVDRSEGLASRSSTTDVTPQQIGDLRGEASGQLRRRLRGDLDNVVLRALEKDPKHRYASVQQFGEDIDRYLNGLPVIARQGTVLYRTGKFIRRNKSMVMATIAIVVALAATAVTAGISLHRVRAERDVTRKVNEVLRGLVGPSDRSGIKEDAVVIRRLCEVADLLNTGFGLDPAAEAATRSSVTQLYVNMHYWSDAERHGRRALALHRALYGDEDERTVDCLTVLGRIKARLGRKIAVEMQAGALASRRRLYGSEAPIIAEDNTFLASALWRAEHPPQWERAEERYRKTIDDLRGRDDGDPRVLANAILGMGEMFVRARRPVEVTKPYILEALDLYRTRPVRKDRTLGECFLRAANLERFDGDYDAERELLEEYVYRTPAIVSVDETAAVAYWRLANSAI